MDAATRELVRRRARDRCEYCGAAEGLKARIRFHVEHIIAWQHGGDDLWITSRWLAIPATLIREPNLSGIDPAAERVAPLFHPRREHWAEHFISTGGKIVGLTETGRATVAVLDMNHPAGVEARLQQEP